MTSLRSMTAFGRSKHSFDKGSVSIEMQSVNRRFLELNFNLPRGFLAFEPALRKHISSRVGRGNVSIFVKFEQNPSLQSKIVPNLAFAKGLKEAWQQIASSLQIEDTISLSLLARQKELFSQEEEIENEESYQEALIEAADRAFKQFVEMKEAEGRVLAQDVLGRLATLEKNSNDISENSSNATENYRQKLQEKMEQLLASPLEDERLMKEVALFAEKVDITEEIIRLNSHIAKAKEMIMAPFQGLQDTKGKSLDFLTQEMLREINTIGSKASDQKIIHLVVESKAELEKIKEQAQNIE